MLERFSHTDAKIVTKKKKIQFEEKPLEKLLNKKKKFCYTINDDWRENII